MPGAPSSQVPYPAKVTELHLRAEENGICESTAQPSGAGQRAASARTVAFGDGSAAAMAPTAASISALVHPAAGSIPVSCMPGAVSVPVLSMQSTSTRASPSMAASSWVSTRLRASRIAPTANATEVSSTSPSGTIAPTPATDPRTASATLCWLRSSWLRISSRPAGTMTQVTSRRIWLVPCWSSDRIRLNRRAWACSRAA